MQRRAHLYWLLPLLLAGCGSLQIGIEPPTAPATLTRAATAQPGASVTALTPPNPITTTAGATLTHTPSDAPATATHAPAITGAPAATSVPNPTNPPAPTVALPTPSPTAPPTAAPTAAPPTAAPTTDPSTASFSADTSQPVLGGNLTLSWRAPAGNTGLVSLNLFSAQGAQPGLQTWRDLPATGSLTVTLDLDPRGPYVFRLAPQAGDWPTLEIPLRFACPDEFFFTSGGAPWPSQVPTDPTRCPASAPAAAVAFQQDFEGGRMIWLNTDHKILVLYGSGLSTAGTHDWAVYDDTWQAGEPESDPALTPPAGRSQPVKGAGKLWRTAEGVRDRLGWALGEAQTYITPDQSDWVYPGTDIPTYRYLRSVNDTLLVLTDYTGHGHSPFWFDFGA